MAYKQHFIEWFSGKQIPSYWSQVGGGTFAMSDEVDGGMKLLTTASTSNKTQLTFGNKRQYSPTASEIIVNFRRLTGSGGMAQSGLFGLGGDATEHAFWRDLESTTYKTLKTGDASTNSGTASDVAVDLVLTNYKINYNTTDIKAYINGVLKVTKTTNRPTVRLQPIVWAQNSSAVARGGEFTYLECYNT